MKLNVKAFWLLKSSGAFSAYEKSELLEGEISGVPRNSESDASIPIKLCIEDYHRLIAAETFKNRTELVDGEIYAMSSHHESHCYFKDTLAYNLRRALEDLSRPLHVLTEQPIAIEPYSELQADVILATERGGLDAIPVTSVALVAQISSDTLLFDLSERAKVYAEARIGEYWVLDVGRSLIHQMWLPNDGVYIPTRKISLDNTFMNGKFLEFMATIKT